MNTTGPNAPLMEDPNAQLERALIVEYLKSKGHTFESLHRLPEAEARLLMTEASLYASARLAEVETRANVVHEIHGITPPLG